MPGRKYFKACRELKWEIPPIAEDIELIRLYGAQTLAVTLNGTGLTPEALIEIQQQLKAQLNIPVIRPLEEGVEPLLPLIRKYLQSEQAS